MPQVAVSLMVFLLTCSCTRSGSQQAFMNNLLSMLLGIADPDMSGQYGWLAGREAGQSSAANAIKVAVWQLLCLLALYVDEQAAPTVRG